jgi:hypothetical protein
MSVCIVCLYLYVCVQVCVYVCGYVGGGGGRAWTDWMSVDDNKYVDTICQAFGCARRQAGEH